MSSCIFDNRINSLLSLLVMIAISGIFTISSVYHPVVSFKIEIVRIILIIVFALSNIFLLINIIKIRYWSLKEYFLLLSFILVNIFLIMMIFYKANIIFRLFVFLFLMFSLFFSTSKEVKKKRIFKKEKEKIEVPKEEEKAKEKIVEELKREAEILKESEKMIERLSKKFVGSKRTKTFHKKNCKLAKKISKKNKVYFQNKSDAVSSGYSACNICNP